MTGGRLYVFSHSALDMVSTLNQYDSHVDGRPVTIVISSTRENLKFLEQGVPADALRFLCFESRESEGKRGLTELVRQLRSDRKQLDALVSEIRANPANEVIFHSSDDPQLGYVIARVAPTHRVTFIDTLETPRQPLHVGDVMSKIGIKNVAMLAVMSWVFGPLFRLAGTRSYPMLTLKLDNLRITRKPRSAGGTVQTLAKYRYRCSMEPGTAVVLYANRFGVDEQVHTSAYRHVLESLSAHGFRIIAKVHPQSEPPQLFGEYGVSCIPKYVPFEFVDLDGVSAVIGMFGASLLSTGNVPTFSILDMVYDSTSDHHRSAMDQLVQNPEIRFVHSREDLDAALAGLAATSGVTRQ